VGAVLGLHDTTPTIGEGCLFFQTQFLTPADKLKGLAQVIFDERDRKLKQARQRRQQARQTVREVA
jgi:hypothetical protein